MAGLGSLHRFKQAASFMLKATKIKSMSKNSGYLVKYTEADGTVKEGVIMHKEQNDEFFKYNKVLIRFLNKDMTPEKDKDGKEIIALKGRDLVSITGFIN